MKILHINTYDTGGAATGCIRMHESLLKAGVDSKILFLYKTGNLIKNSFSFKEPQLPSGFFSKFMRMLDIVNGKAHKIFYLFNPEFRPIMFSFPDTPYNIMNHSFYREADIINLHWTSRFLDYYSFFSSTEKRIVWTLRDMNPFTGGCHYSEGCKEFQKGCKVCPLLKGTINPCYSSEIFNIKKRALESNKKLNLTLVGLSGWMVEQSKSIALFEKFDHYLISNSLAKNLFYPVDKISSRKNLGLHPDKKIIIFVSSSLKERRKGYDLLLKAVERLKYRKDFLVFSVGECGNRRDEYIYEYGKMIDNNLLMRAYSAADFSLALSREESFGNIVLESLICGTPVAAFPVGGFKDMIVHDFNGRICRDVSVSSLVEEIEYMLVNAEKFDRDKIRADSINRYSPELQSEKYIDLYTSLIDAKSKSL